MRLTECRDIQGGHAARPTLNGGGGLVAVGALIGGDVMHVDGGVFVVVGGLSSELKRPSNGAFRGQENGARTGGPSGSLGNGGV